MGNDGGSVPRRDELVKVKKAKVEVLSHDPLPLHLLPGKALFAVLLESKASRMSIL